MHVEVGGGGEHTRMERVDERRAKEKPRSSMGTSERSRCASMEMSRAPLATASTRCVTLVTRVMLTGATPAGVDVLASVGGGAASNGGSAGASAGTSNWTACTTDTPVNVWFGVHQRKFGTVTVLQRDGVWWMGVSGMYVRMYVWLHSRVTVTQRRSLHGAPPHSKTTSPRLRQAA